ncbi:MAG: hypothetical protein ACAH80_06780 [Alphaproteobacteria bacterium]
MLLPKKTEKMTDEELDKGLKQAEVKQQVMHKYHSKAAGPVACALIAAAWWVGKAAFASGNLYLMLGGMVAAAAIPAVGAIVYAIGWTRICNGLMGKWHNDKEKIGKEQKKRAFEKTPAFIEAAIKLKDDIKKAFNDAVDKAFNHGTEKELKVKKPLQLKTAAPKKKSIF